MAQRVLYSLFPNSQHPGSQWHSDYYTDFSWQSFLTIPMAQRLLHRLLLAISFDNPNGTATVTQTSFGNFFWQSQCYSDCYTDFFWQFLLTIPMAKRLLHRLLLAISFDNPNGTATVSQTSFGNLFWQSQWHSNCYTDFFWQFLLTIPMARRLLHRLLLTHQDVTIPMAQRVPSSFWKPLYLQCFSSYTRPSDQTQRPRLVLVKGPCSQPANTLHTNAKVLATCPLDWHFPMEGRRYNLKSGRTLQQSTSQWNASDPERTQKCKTKSVLHTTAIPWAHKLVTKAQRMQTKAQKQQKYCAHDKSHQKTAGTQNDTTSPRAIRLKPTACIYSQQSSINDNNWVGKSEKHVTKQCLCINPSQSLWSAEPITFMLEEKMVNVAPVVSVCLNLGSFQVLRAHDGAIWPLYPAP